MVRISVFVQLTFVAVISAQELSTDVVVSWTLRASNDTVTSFMGHFILPTCMLWSHSVIRRDDYTYTPGIGGHKLHTRALTWNKARRMCENESGHLAIVNSIAEANAIKRLFEQAAASSPGIDFSQAYIGFHDLFEEGEYVTVYGQSLAEAGFTDWASREPNNIGGIENCGTILRNKIQLNDAFCNIAYPYICELPV